MRELGGQRFIHCQLKVGSRRRRRCRRCRRRRRRRRRRCWMTTAAIATITTTTTTMATVVTTTITKTTATMTMTGTVKTTMTMRTTTTTSPATTNGITIVSTTTTTTKAGERHQRVYGCIDGWSEATTDVHFSMNCSLFLCFFFCSFSSSVWSCGLSGASQKCEKWKAMSPSVLLHN